MCSEIEAKLTVDSLKPIELRLADLRADFVEQQLQTDSYFDEASDTLTKTDRCLRLRRVLVDRTEKHVLTYKGAKEKDDFKKRQQIELEIKDAHSFEKLLLAIGYEKKLVFEKRRRLWRLSTCLIALDELPLLGCFVEIEGPDDKAIATVQTDLGLADSPHIVESYAALIQARLSKLGRANREVYFESAPS